MMMISCHTLLALVSVSAMVYASPTKNTPVYAADIGESCGGDLVYLPCKPNLRCVLDDPSVPMASGFCHPVAKVEEVCGAMTTADDVAGMRSAPVCEQGTECVSLGLLLRGVPQSLGRCKEVFVEEGGVCLGGPGSNQIRGQQCKSGLYCARTNASLVVPYNGICKVPSTQDQEAPNTIYIQEGEACIGGDRRPDAKLCAPGLYCKRTNPTMIIPFDGICHKLD